MAVFLNLLGQSYPIGIALLLALVGVIAVGALNGVLTAYAEMPAIFATLATGTFVYGLGRSQFLTQDVIYLPPGHDLFTAFGNARLASIPVEVVVFAFILVGAFLWLRFSKYGRYIYLIGDNLNAARNAGLPVRPVIVLQYVVSALLAFVAGLIMAAGIHSMNTRSSIPRCCMTSFSWWSSAASAFGRQGWCAQPHRRGRCSSASCSTA